MPVLRSVLLVLGGVMTGVGALLALAGCAIPALYVAGTGLVLIVSLAIERWRYAPAAGGSPGRAPGPGWIATGERFVDPESGRTVTVFYHPASGERHYVSG